MLVLGAHPKSVHLVDFPTLYKGTRKLGGHQSDMRRGRFHESRGSNHADREVRASMGTGLCGPSA